MNKSFSFLPDNGNNSSRIFKTIIWTIGGAKGGIGKSFVTSNLGVLFSQMGYKVLLVDADFGAANLHTFLGVDGNKLSLSRFLEGKTPNLQDLIIKTPIPNLEIINGAKDPLEVQNIGEDKANLLQKALKNLDYNHVLLDIGPGTSQSMINLFLMADEGVLISTPDLTSIENTYRFVKCLFFHRIKNIIASKDDSKLKNLIQKIFKEKKTSGALTVMQVVEELKKLEPQEGDLVKALIGKTELSLIINLLHAELEDKSIGISIEKVCSYYFGLQIAFAGDIFNEKCVWESIRFRKPLVNHFKNSLVARNMEAIARKLLEKQKDRKVIKDELVLPRIDTNRELPCRKLKRRRIQKPCIISNGFGRISAKTVDVSNAGVGIKFFAQNPLDIGNVLNIRIEDYNLKTGAKVKWIKINEMDMIRAGLKFCKSLPD